MMMKHTLNQGAWAFFRNLVAAGAVFATGLCGTNVQALQNVTLAWNAVTNSATNAAGYYLYFGTSSTNYSSKFNVGNTTMATVSGLSGISANYYFAVTAYDASGLESPPSNQAEFTTSSNSGPSLAALPTVNGSVNSLIMVSNSVSDSDKVAHTLTYSLVSAPPGMFINTNTGRILWKPQMGDGGTTNTVTVQVADNYGLYSEQSFNVGVSNAVQVTLSPVVVALGNKAEVSVSLACSTPVTNVSFVLDAPTNRVSNITISNLVPTLATITQSPAGSVHSTVTINALSGQTLYGTNTVAQIYFTAITNLPSAFALNNVSSVAGTEPGGVPVPNGFGGLFDVILVGAQPLIRSTIQGTNQPQINLYGQAGLSYQIQSTANWMSTNGWSAFLTSSALGTNLTQVFTNVTVSGAPKYYRVLTL